MEVRDKLVDECISLCCCYHYHSALNSDSRFSTLPTVTEDQQLPRYLPGCQHQIGSGSTTDSLIDSPCWMLAFSPIQISS
ncbi:hypothetical protein STEG23_009836 [Scotinomys teguina]